MKRARLPVILAGASLAFAAVDARAITAGQVDDFQDNTTDSWGGGDTLTTPGGGPLGVSDLYLNLESVGGGGMGSKLATTNAFQWSGNYRAAGVTQIGMDILNPNTSPVATPLNIRIVLFGQFGSRWTSTIGNTIAADNQWHHTMFSLAQADLTLVAGTETYTQTITNVLQLQIRYDAGSTPSSGGTTFAGMMGLDNITAIGTVLPANLTWNNTGGTGDGATWDVATNQNWNNGSSPAQFHTGDNVTFNDTNNNHYNIALNTTVTPGSVVVNNSAGAYVISGSGGIAGNGGLTKSGTAAFTLSTANTFTGNTLVNVGTFTLGSTGSLASGTVTVASGATANINGSLATTATVNANGSTNFGGSTGSTVLNRQLAALNIGVGVTTVATASTFPFTPAALKPTSLTFADSTAKLNLTNNELFTTATLSSIVSRITGGQIFTTITGGALGSLDLGGGQVEVRFTLLGDTNLDGKVDVTDLGNLASNYGATAGATWAQGDSTYNGAVDVSDLGNLASNYGGSLASGPAADSIALPTSESAVATTTAVPEPAGLGLLTAAAGLLATRRRKRV
jgi:autotransporter-associated beta strand protein